MAGMGPPPKHPSQRRRTNPSVAMTQLPAEGRRGEPPTWPLFPDVVLAARRDVAAGKVANLEDDLAEATGSTSAIERKLDAARAALHILDVQLAEQRRLEDEVWRDLWRLPQAVQWERAGWLRDVAQYVRHKVLAELGDLDGAREARQWSDRLGLSPLALLRLRWEIVADEVGERRDERTATPRTRRLKAVDGGTG